MRSLARFAATVPVVLALSLLVCGDAVATQGMLVEVVNADVREHEVEVRVKSTLREPVASTDTKPTMPPYYSREELDAAVTKYGPYLLEHAHLLARAKPITGRVTGARIVDAIDQPMQSADLERAHAEITLVYALASDDPVTISFDVLADKEVEPGVPWPIAYSFDVHGPRSKHTELGTNAQFTFDVVEPSSAPTRHERADAPIGRRRRGVGGSTAIGAIIFAAILYIAYSVIKRRRR